MSEVCGWYSSGWTLAPTWNIACTSGCGAATANGNTYLKCQNAVATTTAMDYSMCSGMDVGPATTCCSGTNQTIAALAIMQDAQGVPLTRPICTTSFTVLDGSALFSIKDLLTSSLSSPASVSASTTLTTSAIETTGASSGTTILPAVITTASNSGSSALTGSTATTPGSSLSNTTVVAATTTSKATTSSASLSTSSRSGTSTTTSPSSTASADPASSGGLSSKAKLALGLGLGLGIPIILAIIACCFFGASLCGRRHKYTNPQADDDDLQPVQRANPQGGTFNFVGSSRPQMASLSGSRPQMGSVRYDRPQRGSFENDRPQMDDMRSVGGARPDFYRPGGNPQMA